MILKALFERSAITRMQAIVIAVIVIIAVVVGVYYATLGPKPTPAEKRLLRTGWSWPTYIDPAVGSDNSASAAFCNLYDPLVWPTPTGTVEPWVAESWTVSEDGLVWTFKIRKGIKFHSGRELTAEDVAFSMERLITIGEGFSYLFAPYVDKTEVVDDYTVRFTLKKPFGPFLTALCRLYIVDKEEVLAHIVKPGPYGEMGDYAKQWLLEHDAGSGPYKVKEVVLEQYVRMEKFEDYWQDFAPKAPTEVVMLATAQAPSTTKTMMLNRELEVTDAWMTDEMLNDLDAAPGIHRVSVPEASEYYFMLHTKKPPLDDVHIRKALAYAFDYDRCMTEIYSRYTKATSCVPKGVMGYIPCQIYHRNLTKAQEELQKSKYYPDIIENPDKYVIKFHWNSDVPERERDALLFAECAAEIGLKVELVKTPWSKIVEESADMEAAGHIYNTLVASHYPEAGSLLESRYHSKNVKSWEQDEWLMNATVDAMIEDALSTIDPDERAQKYAQIQREIMKICPSLFIYDYKATCAIQDYVEWPAAEDNSKAIPLMGYSYAFRLWQIHSEESTTQSVIGSTSGVGSVLATLALTTVSASKKLKSPFLFYS